MKYFLFIFKHFWFTFFSYLCFPMECELCKKSAYFMPICPDCEKRLISEKIVNRCQSCGKELFFEKDLCIKCRNDDIRLQGFLSVYPRYSYVLQKKRLLYLWKVANNRSFVFFFAKAIFRVLQDKYQNIPVKLEKCTPVKVDGKYYWFTVGDGTTQYNIYDKVVHSVWPTGYRCSYRIALKRLSQTVSHFRPPLLHDQTME